jgi:hypothetical protein
VARTLCRLPFYFACGVSREPSLRARGRRRRWRRKAARPTRTGPAWRSLAAAWPARSPARARGRWRWRNRLLGRVRGSGTRAGSAEACRVCG